MRSYIDNILSGNLVVAKEELAKRLSSMVQEKMHHYKVELVGEMFVEEDNDESDDLWEDVEELDEGNIQKMGRTKLVRVRIRNGKVQRRTKLSSVKGYTIRGGKMVRMTALERRHRKMAARKSRYKRRAKLSQTLRKRKISLRRRKAMGVK